VLTSSVVALLCYFSHIAALGFYALVIFGVEARPAIAELRARQWTVLGRRIVTAGMQFALPAVLLSNWDWTTTDGVSYADFWHKAELVFSVFDNYDRVLVVACFALFLCLLGWLGWTRRLVLVPRLGWAICIVFVSYLLMPSQMYGGSGVDHRLPIAWFLLLIASSAPRFPTRRFATAIGFVAGSMLVIRLAVIEHVWRAAFVPTLFAYPGQQPIAVRTSYAALADAAPPQLFWAGLTGGDTAKLTQLLPVLQQYDYVALTGGGPVDVPPNPCLTKFYWQPSFQIFTVLHDPGCASAEGIP
jgi:hypothetical protein